MFYTLGHEKLLTKDNNIIMELFFSITTLTTV